MTRHWSGVRWQLSLLLLLLLVSPSAAEAAPQWLPSVTVSGAGSATSPRVALDPQGNAVAVWADSGIHWAGRPAGTDGFDASALITATGESPAVGVDALGNAIAVWEDNGIQWATRPAGGAFTQEAAAVSPSGSDPDVAVDAQGNATAVWADNGIKWQMRPAGAGGFEIGGVISATGEDPSVALDPDGNAVVVWTDVVSTDAGPRAEIRWATRPAGNGGFEVKGLLGVGERADIGLGPSGAALAVWTRSDRVAWTMRAEGNDDFGSGGLLTGTGKDPQVAFDHEGNAIAVWEEDGIRWAKRPAGGEQLTPAGAISATGEAPDVALDPQGNGIAVWGFADDPTFSVEAARYDPIGPLPPPPPEPQPRRSRSGDDSPSPPRAPRQSSRSSRSQPIARVARKLRLKANRSRISLGRSVRLTGSLKSPHNDRECESRKKIAIQRRKVGSKSKRYQTIDVAITDRNGGFKAKTKPRRTYMYRARASETSVCKLAVSPNEKISVVKKKKKTKRSKTNRRLGGRRASALAAVETGFPGIPPFGSLGALGRAPGVNR